MSTTPSVRITFPFSESNAVDTTKAFDTFCAAQSHLVARICALIDHRGYDKTDADIWVGAIQWRICLDVDASHTTADVRATLVRRLEALLTSEWATRNPQRADTGRKLLKAVNALPAGA